MADQPVVPPASGTEAEYQHVFSFFKHRLGVTSLILTIILGAGTWVFYSKLAEVKDDASREANRVAAREAEASVRRAFDDKNVQAMVLKAAQEKVGTVTDEMIEKQLNTKLRPVQQQISSMGERSIQIGRISECEARIVRSADEDGIPGRLRGYADHPS